MTEHTTDQIQKLLFEKSDTQTKARASAAMATVHTYRMKVGGFDVRMPVDQLIDLVGRDGVPLQQAVKPEWTVQDVLNWLRYARLKVRSHTVLSAFEEAAFLAAQPKDREVYVTTFVAEVENLRATADELADRVQGLEDNAS